MKKIIRIIISLVAVYLICLRFFPEQTLFFSDAVSDKAKDVYNEYTDTFKDKEEATNYDNMKAIWISQYDIYDMCSGGNGQRKESDFRKAVRTAVKNICDSGFNTLFVQVRPFGDSICRSSIFPTSYIVTGDYGREAEYDVFSIILEEAKKKDLSVHAWINPLRLMKDDEIQCIGGEYQISKWYADDNTRGDYIVKSGERWYLNPAYSSVREFICDGVREIFQNYDVDGIHIDDYFYPTTDESFDSEAYGQYVAKGGKSDLATWRRENINSLVRELRKTTKDCCATALFGISPAGVIDTDYNELYADVYTWGSADGYADYICPQIYFGFEHDTCDFASVADRWSQIVSNSNIRLIIGMSATKAYSGIDVWAGSGKNEWAESSDILLRSLSYTLKLKNCSGAAVFSYKYMYDPLSGELQENTKDEMNNLLYLLRGIEWTK